MLNDTAKQITNTLKIMILKNHPYKCLDMSNLYGCEMSYYLPYEEFSRLKNFDKFDISSISEKIPIG